MAQKKKKILLIVILLFLGYLLHRPFFDFNTILFFSDRTNRSDSAVKELFFKGIMTWQSQHGFGEEYTQSSFFGFKVIWGIIGNYAIATKLTFFIPLALLTFVSPFLLSCMLTKNNLIVSFVTSLFYGTVTYFSVKSTAHLPIAMIYVLSPLILMFFLKYIRTYKLHHLLIFNILYFIGIVYEVRIMVIISGILLITLLFLGEKKHRKKISVGFGITIVLQLLINAYWILPVIHLSGDTITQIIQRGLFGNNLFNLSYALTLFESSRTGIMPNQEFIPQPLPVYMRFYPVIILSGFFILKNTDKKVFIRGMGLFLIGVILTKQSAGPIGGLYQFFYDYIPGFKLFREASKFYQITALGYLILLSVIWNARRKINKLVASGLLLLSFIISSILAYPLLNGTIGLIRKPRIMPEAYKEYNVILTNKDVGVSYKTLWIPTTSQWSEYNIQRPKISFTSVNSSTRQNIFTEKNETIRGKIAHITDSLVDRGNIKYVIIPGEDVDKKIFDTSTEEIRGTLETLPFLEPLELQNSNYFQVYVNTGMYGEVFSKTTSGAYTGCDWQKIKSSEVVFSCDFESTFIVFSQAYNPQRKIYKNHIHRREVLRGNDKSLATPEKEIDGLMKFVFPIEKGKKYTLYFIPEARFMFGVYISCLGIVSIIALGVYSVKKSINFSFHNLGKKY